MTQQLEQCLIRILNANGGVVGAGFVVADRLAVTCAHVVEAAASDRGQPISFQFYATTIPQKAQVSIDGWSPFDAHEDANDVAFIHLEQQPVDIVPAVLGTAKGRNRHSYTALGFPYLAGYEHRWADGHLGGVVPAQGKRPTLQFEGGKIKEGMSGAPILDLDTNRVVGMVSEYIDDAGERFAWAITTDTLAMLNPALQLWPDAYGPDELGAYLNHLIESNQMLTLPDGNEVPLERIYVSLRADEMNAIERQAEYDIYLEDVVAFQKLIGASEGDQYAQFAAIRNVIVRHPMMLMLEARNWERLFGEREHGSLNLAEVIQHHPYVVLLGDPGSGKTTAGKWVALQFARALRANKPHVLVYADSIQAGTANNQLIDLGLTRLPIFIRIADYARARWHKDQGDTQLPLEKFLGFHHNPKVLPSDLTPETVGELTQDYLKKGRAFIILDGLDEVGDPAQRRAVMQTVKKFLQAQLPTAITTEQQGNRVLLTSRIVGYQFQPLTHLPHYTIEDMSEEAIVAFCRAWIAYITNNQEATDQQGQKLKETIFNHAHPSLRTMAGNPLLLTILAQVYWANSEHTLPTRRVELFDEAVRTLYNQRKEFWNRAEIQLERLIQALGSVAAFIQANEMTGFVEEGDVREQLRLILNTEQMETLLDVAREASGFLVARGEGVYGFLHRALQEYFAAKYLTDQPKTVVEKLEPLILDPIWREPITLAVGLVSQRNYSGSRRRLSEVFACILNTSDPAGDFLPRRELLAVAACVECERVPSEAIESIVRRLMAQYARNIKYDERNILRKRIQKAFTTLCKSSAERETETVLCNVLTDPDFKYRYAALNIIIENQWDSPAIVRTLVEIWCNFATPAGSLLIALDKIHERHPEYFHPSFLPLKEAMKEDPRLWGRVQISAKWQSVIRALYLPQDGDFSLEKNNRDSPLTPLVLAALHEDLDSDPSDAFRNSLLKLINNPKTASTRDAALILGLLGDHRWTTKYTENADTHELLSLLCYFIHVLSRNSTYQFTLDLTYDLVQSSNALGENLNDLLNEDFSNNLRDVGIHIPQAETFLDLFSIHIDIDLINTLSAKIDNFVATSSTFFDDLFTGFGSALDIILRFDRSDINDLIIDIKDLIDLSNFVEESFKSVQIILSKYYFLGELLAPALTLLLEVLNSTQILHDILSTIIRTLQVLLILSKDFDNKEPLPSASKPLYSTTVKYEKLTIHDLTTLISHLDSNNDEQRDYAKRVLTVGRPASKLGKVLIEQIAEFSLIYAGNSRVSTQLYLALQAVVYNTPSWVVEWIWLTKEKNITPAEIILSHMRHLTFATLKAVLDEIPSASTRAKMALLGTMSWLARRGRLPQDDLVYERLIAWLDLELQPNVHCAIIKVLGYCRENVSTVSTVLLAKVNHSNSKSELSALYLALAHIARYQSNIALLIRPMLQLESSQPEVAAAFVRLILAEVTHKWISLSAAGAYEAYKDRRSPASTAYFSLRNRALFDLSRRLFTHSQDDPDIDPFRSSLLETEHREKIEAISIGLLSVLCQTLTDPAHCLTALLDAGTDDDIWNDEYHGVLVNATRIYLERNPDLLPMLLTSLKRALLKESWPSRRIKLATVAACIETMPIAVQRACNDDLETLLVKGTIDANSSSSRRFALTALSYLRTVTPAIIPALIAGCLDTEVVRRNAIAAAARFQSIEDNLLPTLIAALKSESAGTVYAVTQLLSALGTSVAGDSSRLRGSIIVALVDALKQVNSQRRVFIPSEYEGSLEEIIYAALLEVTGWR